MHEERKNIQRIYEKLRYISDLYKLSFCWNVQSETHILNELNPTYLVSIRWACWWMEAPLYFPKLLNIVPSLDHLVVQNSGDYLCRNMNRLGVFMFQTSDNSQLCNDTQYSSQ